MTEWETVTCIAGGTNEEVRGNGCEAEGGAQAAAECQSAHTLNAGPGQDRCKQLHAGLAIQIIRVRLQTRRPKESSNTVWGSRVMFNSNDLCMTGTYPFRCLQIPVCFWQKEDTIQPLLAAPWSGINILPGLRISSQHQCRGVLTLCNSLTPGDGTHRSVGNVDEAGVVLRLQQRPEHMQQLRLRCQRCQHQHRLGAHPPHVSRVHLHPSSHSMHIGHRWYTGAHLPVLHAFHDRVSVSCAKQDCQESLGTGPLPV